MLLRSNFSSFPHYFIYIFLTSGVKLHIHLLNVVVQFIVFLPRLTLICRGTDISKCFIEFLGFRDNESRLYFFYFPQEIGFDISCKLSLLEFPKNTGFDISCKSLLLEFPPEKTGFDICENCLHLEFPKKLTFHENSLHWRQFA